MAGRRATGGGLLRSPDEDLCERREKRARDDAALRKKMQREEVAGTKRKITLSSAEQEDGDEDGSGSDWVDDFVRDIYSAE